MRLPVGRKRTVAIVVAVMLVSAGTAAAVTIAALSFDPVQPAQGSLSQSALDVQSSQIEYSGLNATGVTLNVTNPDGSLHTADVHVDFENSTSGTVVASGSQTGVSVPASGSTTVTVSISPTTNVTDFDNVVVRIEETG